MSNGGSVRLAAIGDSLTRGFQHGAIHNTSWSYPAMIARSLGLEVGHDFLVPVIRGRNKQVYGYPINLEEMLRSFESTLGSEVHGLFRWLWRFPRLLQSYFDITEDYYERGEGSKPYPFKGAYNNLAVWGFNVNDSLSMTQAICNQQIKKEEGFFEDDFWGLPSAPVQRSTKRVINPSDNPQRINWTQLDCLKYLQDNGGVDTLILWLGNNDALGTTISLTLKDMAGHNGAIPNHPIKRMKWNLTSRSQFESDYTELDRSPILGPSSML